MTKDVVLGTERGLARAATRRRAAADIGKVLRGSWSGEDCGCSYFSGYRGSDVNLRSHFVALSLSEGCSWDEMCLEVRICENSRVA